MGDSFLLVAGWLVIVNSAAYGAFAWDKRLAKQPDASRIPEKTLLKLAVLGGGAGAKIAQKRLRHKSYKQPFGRRLNTSIAISVAVPLSLVAWAYWPI